MRDAWTITTDTESHILSPTSTEPPLLADTRAHTRAHTYTHTHTHTHTHIHTSFINCCDSLVCWHIVINDWWIISIHISHVFIHHIRITLFYKVIFKDNLVYTYLWRYMLSLSSTYLTSIMGLCINHLTPPNNQLACHRNQSCIIKTN